MAENNITADEYRIRKLTPRECGRLMDFDDTDMDAMEICSCSNTQMYKSFGNSICVGCISLLAEHIYKAYYDENYVCLDERMNA